MPWCVVLKPFLMIFRVFVGLIVFEDGTFVFANVLPEKLAVKLFEKLFGKLFVKLLRSSLFKKLLLLVIFSRIALEYFFAEFIRLFLFVLNSGFVSLYSDVIVLSRSRPTLVLFSLSNIKTSSSLDKLGKL